MEKKLPNFLIIGCMKSATTSLYDDLKINQDFHLPDDKEPAILLKAKNSDEAIKLYNQHFDGNFSSELIKGEASTYYTMQPLYPNRSNFAHEVLGPDLKLIIIFRDPIDRIISHICHDYSVGRIKHRNVDQAIKSDIRYVSFSDYAMQLKPWVETFGKDNILCISFRRYVNNRLEVVKEVADFVGADPTKIQVRADISNKNSDILRPLLPQQLVSFYQNHIKPRFKFSLLKMSFFRRLLFKKQTNLPPIHISEKMRAELQAKFSNVEHDIFQLSGQSLEL